MLRSHLPLLALLLAAGPAHATSTAPLFGFVDLGIGFDNASHMIGHGPHAANAMAGFEARFSDCGLGANASSRTVGGAVLADWTSTAKPDFASRTTSFTLSAGCQVGPAWLSLYGGIGSTAYNPPKAEIAAVNLKLWGLGASADISPDLTLMASAGMMSVDANGHDISVMTSRFGVTYMVDNDVILSGRMDLAQSASITSLGIAAQVTYKPEDWNTALYAALGADKAIDRDGNEPDAIRGWGLVGFRIYLGDQTLQTASADLVSGL